jgi:hypothetical protein
MWLIMFRNYVCLSPIYLITDWSNGILTKYHSGDQVKKSEMGRTCSTYGGKQSYVQGFSAETWGKETTWKTQT